jgi:hypothetical protein
MKATLLSATLFAAGLIANTAFAQGSFSAGPPVASPPVAYHHASTLEEGFFRGAADFARAAGEFDYNHSLAAINQQEAHSRYLDNRLKRTATYFDMRKMNREARAEERGQRVSLEDAARFAKDRAPDRLSAAHLDAARSRLVWPAIFNDPYFARERAAIDRLMADRAGAGPESRQIQALAEQMTHKLKHIVHEVKPSEYGAAKRFLASVQYEMDFVPGAVGVAVR